MPVKYLDKAAEAFQFAAAPIHLQPLSAGHINYTYLVDCGAGNPQYILQRVNTEIFKNPFELMSNIKGVSRHIACKAAQSGGDPGRMARTIIETKSREDYYIDPDGGYWRSFLEIDDVVSFDFPGSPELFYKSAVAFGRFFKQLSDYPVEMLYVTIPDFHNTLSRMQEFKQALAQDKLGRAAQLQPEIEFILSAQPDCSYITDRIADGRIPLHVTHNDAKLSNILMDKNTGAGVCIIDLDTIMPGSILYDFGEAIRFGASAAREDETDLDKVQIDLAMFEIYVRGYLEEIWDVITREELLGFPMGAYLMTLETGMRFLGDYLNGDTYYQIHYPGQNLDRARNQLKLAENMKEKIDQMAEIVQRIYYSVKKGQDPCESKGVI